MLQSSYNITDTFYSYVVDELLIDFFNNHTIQPGSRYFIIIDNEEHRKGFISAVEQSIYSDFFKIQNIFNANQSLIGEDVYNTFVLKAPNNDVPLIIGNSSNATDDYLTTLRNAVSLKSSQYSKYGILYILSNNRLESLTTTCTDLQSVGMPLNCLSIKSKLENIINGTIGNDYEKCYLRYHLKRLSEKIDDGGYSLFDFQEILSVLSHRTLSGSFETLGYFEDQSIYNTSFTIDEEDLQTRTAENASYYGRISDIFCQSEGNERTEQLSAFLDDRLAQRLAKFDNLHDIDYEDIQQSIEKKNASSAIAYEDCCIELTGNYDPIIKRIIGNKDRKSSVFILVCDNSNRDKLPMKLSFKTEIKDKASEGRVNGRNLRFDLTDDAKYIEVGKDNNIHKFYIKRVRTNKAVFEEIKTCFKLKKKGGLIVDIADDVQSLTLGFGQHEIDFQTFDRIDWKEDYRMVIPLDIDKDVLNRTIYFNDKPVDFCFKISNKSTQPKSPLSVFQYIWTKKAMLQDCDKDVPNSRHFSKLCSVDDEFSVYDSYRKYLCLEQEMVDCQAYALRQGREEYEFEPIFVNLPDTVANALNEIYKYFKDNQTIPSLTYINDDLAVLYNNYLVQIYLILSQIPENRTLHADELDMTKLGVVETQRGIMFSPFHPLMVAYLLEFKSQFDHQSVNNNVLKLITPFYLIPYLYYENKVMRPYADAQTEEVKTWLFYETVNNKEQIKTYDITSKMVYSKLKDFIGHFSYLFQDINTPIVISTIGIKDDSYVIKGIVEFIKDQYPKKGVQKIEIHEYVNDLLSETFFEKLNRLNQDDLIIEALTHLGLNLDKKDQYTSREIIRQLFTRVIFYKHSLQECDNHIGYSHIAFYMMDPECEYVTPPTKDMRVELSMKGLISIPSTVFNGKDYNIGFGANGLKMDGAIYQIVSVLNELYANARNHGHNKFQKNICVAKSFSYDSTDLLNSIYTNANWVTFLNPEVDINFFYNQKDLYIVHYTDQYTINAKYDSITVTKHIDQYENMLANAYKSSTSGTYNIERFNTTMRDYFNSLNGSWLLGIVNKTESQIREKLSIVAASIVMKHFLKRIPDVIWIPISMEEILRVSGSIGLPKDDSIFSAKALGEKGALSDDLLMIGLKFSNSPRTELLFYPVEVKLAKSAAHKKKGENQIAHTYQILDKFLVEEKGFINNIYKTFFASQFLTNADKLYANQLLLKDDYDYICSHRFNLLNTNFFLTSNLVNPNIGKAALVYFYTLADAALETKMIDDVPICHVILPESKCFKCVADPAHELSAFLSSHDIALSNENADLINSVQFTQNPKRSTVSQALMLDVLPALGVSSDGCSNQMPNNHKESNGLEQQVKESKVSDISFSEVTSQSGSPDKAQHNEHLQDDNSSIKIKLGTSTATGEDVIFEPNNTSKVSHPNLGIIGTMGTGKTQLARSIIAQYSIESIHNVGGKPIGLLVFDYKGDYKDKEFLDIVHGKCYRSNFPFNPLKLVITEDAESINLPAITADRISDSFAKAYGLGLKQQSTIKQIIIQTYEDAGITRNPITWSNTPPTISDVVKKFFESNDSNDKAAALFDKLNDYSIFTEENTQCVSLFEWLDGVKVIDLTLYPDDTKKVIVALILDLFYAEMKQLGGSQIRNGLRQLRSMIMVDEAHQFLSKGFASLRNIISEGRMFGVGMILSTQNVCDFKGRDEEYSQFILSWIIHHVNNVTKPEMATIFGANDPNGNIYMDFISKAKLFESVCKIGSQVYSLKDLPYYLLIQEDKRFKQA